jgi:predicted PurR-regulated permease PerM
LEVMGLAGIIVGPIIMALAIAVLRLYAEEEQASRAASETMK